MFWDNETKYCNEEYLASFVDERDDDIPGPGAHNMKRFDKHPISQWKFGKVAADRGAFLRTPSRKSPSPCHY
jgi:hypothetical protein